MDGGPERSGGAGMAADPDVRRGFRLIEGVLYVVGAVGALLLVTLSHAFASGESEAAAAAGGLRCLAAAPEPVEDAGQLVGGDPGAAVGDLQQASILAACGSPVSRT
jgi:hypothetical protein